MDVISGIHVSDDIATKQYYISFHIITKCHFEFMHENDISTHENEDFAT